VGVGSTDLRTVGVASMGLDVSGARTVCESSGFKSSGTIIRWSGRDPLRFRNRNDLPNVQSVERNVACERLYCAVAENRVWFWKFRDSRFNLPLRKTIEIQEVQRKLIVSDVQNIRIEFAGLMP
jgi:hypothetical protein